MATYLDEDILNLYAMDGADDDMGEGEKMDDADLDDDEEEDTE